MHPTAQFRRRFYKELVAAIRIVWPVLSALVGVLVALGAAVAHLEGWPLLDGVYFAFVTGLTVGYGDLVPARHVSRVVAIAIAFTGILLTALLAAIAVRALQDSSTDRAAPPGA